MSFIALVKPPYTAFRTMVSRARHSRLACWSLAGAFGLVASTAQAVPTLSVQGTATGIDAGGTYIADVLVADVDSLYTFNLDISYEAAELQFESVTTGGFLETGGPTAASLLGGLSPETSAASVGDISNTLLGPLPGASGSGILASLEFTALSLDPPAPSLAALNQPAGTELVDAAGERITAATTAEVPLPAPAALLVPGLGLLTLMTRRR